LAVSSTPPGGHRQQHRQHRHPLHDLRRQ
jgi:hypothetical protein